MACLQRHVLLRCVMFRRAKSMCCTWKEQNYSVKDAGMISQNHHGSDVKLKNKKTEIKEYNKSLGYNNISQLKSSSENIENDYVNISKIEMAKNLSELKEVIDNMPLCKKSALLICKKFLYICHSSWYDKVNIIKDFAETKTLYKLCSVLNDCQHTLNPYEVLNVFQMLVLLNISPSSPMMQKTITLLLEYINMLSPIEVSILYEHCGKLEEKTNLSESLTSASLLYMNYCFEDNLLVEISPKVLSAFIGKASIPKAIKTSLFELLIGYGVDSFTPKIYKNIFNGCKKRSLNKLEICDSSLRKIKNGLKCILKSPLNPNDFFSIFHSYTTVHINNYDFYDKEIYDMFATKVVEEKLSLGMAVTIMKSMCYALHFNSDLNEYVFSNLVALEQKNHKYFSSLALNFLNILSTTGFYGLENSTQNFLMDHFQSDEFLKMVIPKNSPEETSVFKILSNIISMAAIGVYQKEVVTEILDFVLKQLVDINFNEDYFYPCFLILWIHNWLNLFHPEHEGKIPETVINACLSNVLQVQKLSWSSAIGSLNQNYILSNCITPLKLPLHYVMVLGENKKFVDLSRYKANAPVSISDLDLPENSRIIVLHEPRRRLGSHFLNVSLPTRRLIFFSKVLKRFGYDVIFLASLNSHPKTEKESIALLLKNIMEICGTVDLDIIKR